MRKALGVLSQSGLILSELRKAEDGAALIEYTVLLGMLVVAVVTIIAAVGGWVNTTWSTLNSKL